MEAGAERDLIEEGDGLAVALRDDVALHVGAVDLRARVPEAAEHLVGRVAVAVNIQEENRVVFLARIQAVLSGYEPCGRCKP